MSNSIRVIVCIFAMALTTYLIRALPLILVRKKIKNQLVVSFLYYLPYTVLSAMTVPAVFFSTDLVLPAVFGVLVASLLAWKGIDLIIVALSSCAAVYIADIITNNFLPSLKI